MARLGGKGGAEDGPALMKVLIVSHPCATPINQEIFATIRRLTGWKLTMVIPRSWKDEFGNLLDEEPLESIADVVQKVPVFGRGNIIFHLYRKRWGNFLRREKFDCIYLHQEPYAPATAQIFFANAFQSSPAAFGFYSAQNLEKKYPPPFGWMEKRVLRYSNFSFPVSESVAEVLLAKGCRAKPTVCPLPVDTDRYRPLDNGTESEGTAAPGRKRIVIGFVGRLVAAKGLRTLAEALSQLREADWRMVVVGTGEFQSEFAELLSRGGVADRVEFVGYVPHQQTPDYLRTMDILVVPSETQPNWKEQFGRVILEALACGGAVVGSDSGEIPKLLSRCGGGLVFPEGNGKELSSRLQQLLGDETLRKQFAATGRQWVVENAGLEPVATKMAETMERATTLHRRST